MNTRNRLIAGLVFALLAVSLIVVALKVLGDEGTESEAELVPTSEAAEPLFPDAEGKVVNFVQVVDNQTGQTFAAGTEDGFNWTVEQAPEGFDTAWPVDSTTITSAVVYLADLTPQRILDGVEALAPYGLDNVRYTVNFRVMDGGEFTLYVGSPNPTNTAYYVRLTETDNPASDIYLVAAYYMDQVIEFLTSPPLIQPSPTPEVVQD